MGLVKAVNLGNFWNEKWKNKMVILSFKMVIWGIHGYIKRKKYGRIWFWTGFAFKIAENVHLIGENGWFCTENAFKMQENDI